jgi:hypothetical protein
MQLNALSLMVLTAKKSDMLVRYGIRCRNLYFFHHSFLFFTLSLQYYATAWIPACAAQCRG